MAGKYNGNKNFFMNNDSRNTRNNVQKQKSSNLQTSKSPRSVKSPAKVIMDDVLVPVVMTALNTLVTKRGLMVINIAKSVITKAAVSVPGLAVVPAVSALITGGLCAYQAIKSSRSPTGKSAAAKEEKEEEEEEEQKDSGDPKNASDVLQSMNEEEKKELVRFMTENLFGLSADLARDIVDKEEVKGAAIDALNRYFEKKYYKRVVT